MGHQAPKRTPARPPAPPRLKPLWTRPTSPPDSVEAALRVIRKRHGLDVEIDERSYGDVSAEFERDLERVLVDKTFRQKLTRPAGMPGRAAQRPAERPVKPPPKPSDAAWSANPNHPHWRGETDPYPVCPPIGKPQNR
jgi:hypothetical protein